MDKSSKAIKPIFIFSLPRSGSTLAQRILGSCDEVATTAEPWLLLPFLYTLKGEGSFSEYSHLNSVNAIGDFINELPNGKNDYIHEMHDFVLRLYSKASNDNAVYFLDKTPRYHLIAGDVVNMFPEGKFIYLWRNPLAIIASIMETWGKGKWNLYRFKIDIYDGLSELLLSFDAKENNCLSVQYEELVQNPRSSWEKICDYLGVVFEESMLDGFGEVKLKGIMGDPTGVKDYQSVSTKPLEKWKKTLANPIRKIWCRRYLNWIGEERISKMGYDISQLHSELDRIPTSYHNFFSDCVRVIFGIFFNIVEPKIIKRKLLGIKNRKKLHVHT